MKKLKIELLMLICIINVGLNAQINTEPGELQGGNVHDTAHYHDDASKHVHEEVIVLDSNIKGHYDPYRKGDVGMSAQDSATSGINSEGEDEETSSDSAIYAEARNFNPYKNEPPAKPLVLVAMAFLGLGVLIGLYLSMLLLRHRRNSLPLSIAYALAIVTGIIILLVYSTNHLGPWLPIFIFLVTSTGSFVMFYLNSEGVEVPAWLAVLQGGLTVTGLVLLGVFAHALP